jgi:hypothetical protein
MARSRGATYVAAVLIAGSLGTFLVELSLCRWPAPHPLSPTEALFKAATYVSIAVLSGAAINRLLWFPSRMAPSVSLSLFTIASAIGWIWIPSVVLLSRQRSIAAVLMAALAAVMMASGLRRIMPAGNRGRPHSLLPGEWKERELFAEYLNTAPREMHGFIIAVCFYSGLFAWHGKSFIVASFLMALCAFVLSWKLRGDAPYAPENRENRSRAALRLARATSTAVLVTMGLLLLGLPHGAFSGAMGASAHNRTPSGRRVPQQHKGTANPASGISGYERIILWPLPEKKKIVVPTPSKFLRAGFNTSKPMTIPFDGAYWYFQPRGTGVGTRVHAARGSPLTVNIRSTNHIPLIMEAHQTLGAAIPLACCREMQVTIENSDNAPGIIAIGALLTDSTSLGKPTFYLGQQTVLSTEPSRFTVKSSPVPEVLHFPIPDHTRIEEFDEITIVFFPDSERPYTGAKIAIKQFDLVPR